ncbi:DNA-binding protein [Ectopseudomonas mendocina]|nr:helix-turn-helix domain-containing protein [Pseudomonas mendocina]TRO21989.1 DNA-binding protein [Pseudomonas mendocina]TRO29355.1 DNA-binding protein [Pseudomonas mendocina]
MSDLERLLSPEETAQALGLSVKTLATWRSTKRHQLPFVKVGNRVRYRAEDVSAWLQKMPNQTTPRPLKPANSEPRTAALRKGAGAIQVSGDAYLLHRSGECTPADHISGTLVGLAWMGSNNAENDYGLTGMKSVVLAGDSLWIIDFPASAQFQGIDLTDWMPDPIYAEHLPLGILDIRSRPQRSEATA